MSLKLDMGGRDFLNLSNPRFDENIPAFLLSTGGGGSDVLMDYPSPFQQNVPYGDYSVYAFARHDYSENDIFGLYLKQPEKRIGMVFPLQAAVSREHDKADDITFLRFAQGAFMALCNGIETAYLKQPDASKRIFSIFDFYPSNTIVVAIYKPQLVDVAGFHIDDYLASFIKYGYFLQTPGLDPRKIASENKDRFEAPDTRVSIQPIAPEMQKVAFITHLLKVLLPYADTSLLRFFYLYQIVELMMGTLLELSFTEFKQRLSIAQPVSSGIREVMEDLHEQLSEKKRMSKLFDRHITPSIDLNVLRGSCNEFLTSLGSTSATPEHQRGVAEFLYPVRNVLFHNFRIIEPSNLAKLDEIAAAMRIAVCDMLMRFSKT